MTKTEKRDFIVELVSRVEHEILHKIPLMPEEWDGHELRKYVSDKFQSCVFGSSQMNNRRSRRYKDYQNAIITMNL